MTQFRTLADCIGNCSGQPVPIPAGTACRYVAGGTGGYAVADEMTARRLVAATGYGDADNPRGLAAHAARHHHLWLPDGVALAPIE